jgi:predicted DNA binding CopG/RHH family protein
MRKKFPVLKTDEEAEAFLAQDLSDYLHSGNFAPYRFEFQPKEKSVNLRISEDLLKAVQASAKRKGIPYQRYIRQALERALVAKAPRARAAARTPRRGARAAARGGK